MNSSSKGEREGGGVRRVTITDAPDFTQQEAARFIENMNWLLRTQVAPNHSIESRIALWNSRIEMMRRGGASPFM